MCNYFLYIMKIYYIYHNILTEVCFFMEKLLIEIKNKQGLHLRPATLIFKTLNSYDSKLWIGETDNMEEMLEVKRVFDLLDLAAGFGTKLFLIAEGEDEILLLNDLRKLIEVEKFGEG